MDPFHVVRVAGDTLDECWRRVQQDTFGHREHDGDPLYKARRALHTGVGLLSAIQTARLEELSTGDLLVEVEATWGVYQHVITAYRDPKKKKVQAITQNCINGISSRVPAVLVEIRRLGRTFKPRAPDILAYFDRTGTSNGTTEAINGRLERLHGLALGFRNLTHYLARCLLEAGGFQSTTTPSIMNSRSVQRILYPKQVPA